MYVDAQLAFSINQPLTATAFSTNIIDFGVGRNLGDGAPISLVIVPNVAAKVSAGNETYQVDIQTAIDSAFTTPITVLSQVIPGASLALGKKVVMSVPVGQTQSQYMRLLYTLGGTAPTLTVESFIEPVALIEKMNYYKDNSNIS